MTLIAANKGTSGGGGGSEWTDSGTATASANQEKTYTFNTGISDIKSFRLVGTPTTSAWASYRILVEWDKNRSNYYFSFMLYSGRGEAYGAESSVGVYSTTTYGQNLPKVESVQNGEVIIKTPSISDARWANFTYECYAVG